MINDKKKDFFILILLILYASYILSTLITNNNTIFNKDNHYSNDLVKEYSLIQEREMIFNSVDRIIEKYENNELNLKSKINIIESLIKNKKNVEYYYKNKLLRIKNNSNIWFNNVDDKFPIKLDNLFAVRIVFNTNGKEGGGISFASKLGESDYKWWVGLKEIYFGIDSEKRLDIQIKNDNKECNICIKIPLRSKEESVYEFILLIDIDKDYLFFYDKNNFVNYDNKRFDSKIEKNKNLNLYKIRLFENQDKSSKFFENKKLYIGIGLGKYSEIVIKFFDFL
ncbi:MAG: hypothetical protein KatS3mg092_0639 [Patescibacteria group bacterium]|nr:MAG: hypothetical protein KatS3mg092_0639 [Patescibacteria group bacterium]